MCQAAPLGWIGCGGGDGHHAGRCPGPLRRSVGKSEKVPGKSGRAREGKPYACELPCSNIQARFLLPLSGRVSRWRAKTLRPLPSRARPRPASLRHGAPGVPRKARLTSSVAASTDPSPRSLRQSRTSRRRTRRSRLARALAPGRALPLEALPQQRCIRSVIDQASSNRRE